MTTALVKHRDLLSAGLALGFVVFVLGSVIVKTLLPVNTAGAAIDSAAAATSAAPAPSETSPAP